MTTDELVADAVRLNEKAKSARVQARRWTDQRNQRLREAWDAGADMAALGRALGMSTQAISKALDRPTGRTWTNEP